MSGLGLHLGLGLNQYSSNFNISNPQITSLRADIEDVSLIDILKKGKLSALDKMVQAEGLLFSRWNHEDDWEEYLDSPLLAHADAALSLKNQGYNAVIGIEEKGVPYAEIFGIMGFPVYSIDYSHHRRNMDKPSINQEDLKELKGKKAVLVDVDFVTGKTLKKVIKYLGSNNVNIDTVYLGLSEWPGIESDSFYIDNGKVDFEKFWKTCGSLRSMKCQLPYQAGIIPRNVRVLTSDSAIGEHGINGSSAATRIAKYFQRVGDTQK